MDPALFADAGAELGAGVEPLGDGDANRAGAVGIGEQPQLRRGGLPVGTPVREQARGQGHVAVPGPLALLDAHGHPVGVEIGDLEVDQLAHPQAGGIGGGEQEAVADARAGVEQAPDLLAAEDLGELLGLPGGRDDEVRAIVTKGDVVEEAEGVSRLVTRAPGQLALLEQVGEVVLDLVGGELIRRAFVVLRQVHHGGDVGRVGARGEATDGACRGSCGCGARSWGHLRRRVRTETIVSGRRPEMACGDLDGRPGARATAHGSGGASSNLPRQRFSSTTIRLQRCHLVRDAGIQQ